MNTLPISSLETLNTVSSDAAQTWFLQTCASEAWCHAMVEARPFTSTVEICKQASTVWQTMGKEDLLQAFSAHPMIGDISTLRAKYANTKAIAANEQSGTQAATEDVLTRLQSFNQAYLNKHGFIFIICATGLSAAAMLDALMQRLPNDTEQEIAIAAKEQLKITLLRISKALSNTTLEG